MSGSSALVDDPDDPELNELLDNALADFGRPKMVSPQSETVACATGGATSAAATGGCPPGACADPGTSEPSAEQMAALGDIYKSFEEAMKQALKGDASSDAPSGDAFSSMVNGLTEELARTDVENSDDSLAKTLADLTQSLSADAEKALGDDDAAEILRRLSGLEGSTEEAGGLDSLLPLMQTVMSSVLSKDVLHPALKDVCERYPAWLQSHTDQLDPAELQRYRQQHALMQQVCDQFEAQKPDDPADVRAHNQEKVFQLMQQLQALGQPPKELVGESDLGLQFDAQGNPRLPSAAPGECSLM